jgi:multiple sugar transport system substrate-binding protein
MTYDSWANAYGRLSRWCGSLNEYAPDMTIIPDQWMGEFSDHLYAFGPGFTQHLQAFFPLVLAPAIIDGRTHGVPWRMDSQVLYYRTDLLAEAGQSPPQTWEQLSAAATEVANPSKGIYGFGLPGAVSGGGANLLLTLLWSSGGAVVDDDGEIHLVSEQMIAALDYCVQLARSGALQPEVLAWDQASLQQTFMDGKLAMLIADSTLATRLHQSKTPPDYAVSSLPAGDHPLAFVSMSYLVVMRTSRHREACQEFLKYMASKDVQERMLQTGTIPSHWEVAERFKREALMGAFVANLEHAHSRPNHNWELLQAGLDDALFLAISGRMSATEALELVQAKYFSATPETE